MLYRTVDEFKFFCVKVGKLKSKLFIFDKEVIVCRLKGIEMLD